MNNSQDTTRTIIGMLLIGFGGLFLLTQATGANVFGLAWPLIVLIPGLIFLALALRATNEETLGFIFPGVVVTGTGVILSYQNITNHWESWAYIWALYPVFVGVAMRFMAQRTDNAELGQVGQRLMLFGTVGFVALGALFELFIFNGGDVGLVAPLVPVLMIGAGIFMILRGGKFDGKAKRKSHEI